MRYVTKQLWRGTQVSGSDDSNSQRWSAAAAEYQGQLGLLRPRLSDDAFEFFSAADVHDAELISLEVRDGSRPALRTEPTRAWQSPVPNPVSVQLSVLDAEERYLWRLRYTSVRRAQVDFPSEDPLFYGAGSGFGDLGYHELTDAGDGFLRHEFLFATGATATFEFRDVEVTQEPWRSDDPRPPG